LFRRSLTLDYTYPRTRWFQPGPSSFCPVDILNGAVLGTGTLVETLSLRLRFPCARFAAKAFASFHLLQPRYLAVWLAPQMQHYRCYFGVTHIQNWWLSPHATHLRAYPELCCVFLKHCLRFRCRVPLRNLYVSTSTSRPQISVCKSTFAKSGPLATDNVVLMVRFLRADPAAAIGVA
jgi:hypothetical protein